MKRGFSSAIEEPKLACIYDTMYFSDINAYRVHDSTNEGFTMQVCEPYNLEKCEIKEIKEEIYDECEELPNPLYDSIDY